jgi:signal transduction histidine kinase
VPADLLPRLFERGVRGAAPPSGGTSHGIGLFIVQRVMELHGGHVLVARNSPQGLTMRLVLRPQPEDDE